MLRRGNDVILLRGAKWTKFLFEYFKEKRPNAKIEALDRDGKKVVFKVSELEWYDVQEN